MKTTPISLLKGIYFAVLAAGIGACNGKTEIPEQSISLKQAEVLQQEFVQTRAKAINEYLGYEDTRDFWFSLETMEEYIAYVKAEGAAKGYKNMGIQVYFAAYPKNMKDEKVDPGFSTVILVPTTQTSFQHQPDMERRGFFPMPPENNTAKGINALNYGEGGHPPINL